MIYTVSTPATDGAATMPRLHELCFFLVFALFAHTLHASDPLVPRKAEDVQPIAVGAQLPSFTFVTADEKPFQLDDAIKQSPVLLVIYRGSWCPYCNTHLAELRKIEKNIAELGIQMFAISPDLPKYLRETGDKHNPAYTLLSDSKMVAAKALGLAFKVDSATRQKYKTYDIDLQRNSGEQHHLLPVPAAILVDKTKKVNFIFYAPDYKSRIDNGVLLAAAKAMME